MEIDKLKSVVLNLEGKLKVGSKGTKNQKNNADGEISEISSVSEQSFVNQNEEIYKKLRELQYENENVKLEVNAKSKIIEKLKNDLKEKDKLKA